MPPARLFAAHRQKALQEFAMSSMNRRERVLTELDHVRLSKLGHQTLADVLDEAEVVSPPSIPADVVTMYSQVLIAETGAPEPRKYTLCYPNDAEPQRGFISVCSPFGASLIGRRVGHDAVWTTPHGDERAVTIQALLFQPEASGDYTT
jgi:regulator of nucleoside diphosphate kinase